MALRFITVPVVLLGILSCAPDAARTTTEQVGEPPEWTSIEQAWNQRADSIDALHGWGIAELRWLEEDGSSRMEQGELDLWYEAPGRLAIRISKFGETYLVYGTNGLDDWLYTNQSEEMLKWSSEQDVSFSLGGSSGVEQGLQLDADTLLVALGLRRLPAGSGQGVITWNRSHDAWESDIEGISSLPMKWWTADGDDYPSRMAITGAGHDVIMWEDRSRALTVRLPGMPITACPILPGSITILSMNGETEVSRTLVVFQGLVVDVEDQPMDRVFDVDAMEAGLKPRSVRVLGNESIHQSEDSKQ